MSANFTPNQNEYKNLTPFKNWLLLQINTWGMTNFPFVESDFDELTNYGMMQKLMGALNDVISNENEVEQDMTNLFNAFTELQTYVNDYFANIDVQDEINNKLDSMVVDGTLTQLIGQYVQPLINEQNQQIELIDTKVDAVASGSPLVATSTSEMTDTDRVYVNITDGKWYYYDGTTWTDGGTYQATQIADGSIDILKLDENLQNNFLITYSDFESLGNDFQGFCSNNNGTLNISTSATQYFYNIVDLEIGGIYQWNGYSSYSSTGLIVVDSADNSVVWSSPTDSRSLVPNSYIFKVNKSGLKAYMSNNEVVTTATWIGREIKNQIRKIENVSIAFLKSSFPLEPLFQKENSFCNLQTSVNFPNWVWQTDYNGVNWDLYPIEKGKKYIFDGFTWSGVSGLLITDTTYIGYYKDPQTGTSPAVPLHYEFVAEQDGFAICHDIQTKGYTFTCESPDIENIIDDVTERVLDEISFPSVNKMGFSKLIAVGDSITEVNFRALHNYLYWIENDIPDLTIQNLGISGSGYMNGNNTFVDRIDSISTYNLASDVVIVMGSINDIQHVPNHLGQLGDTTTETLYGSMYQFFTQLFTKFNGVRIGCISPINWKNSHGSNALNKYTKALQETCSLFNVPYLDMTNNTNLRPDDDAFLTAYYTADGTGNTGQVDTGGVHPNSAGHRLFYGRIKEFICKL